jgi:hypothetical protein
MIYIDIVKSDSVANGEIWVGDKRVMVQQSNRQDVVEISNIIANAFRAIDYEPAIRKFEPNDISDAAGPFRIEHEHDLAGVGDEFGNYEQAVSFLRDEFEAEGDETATCYEVLNRFGNTVYMHRQDWQDDE